ncbi:MAG TPA: tRNA dihydrouridine synthase DusB [Sphaerochaeta sp.]|jgi:nifR3 family TIM-barrel protein|nr:tRNA dihydrouridine synthase DusB [Sphaerochaeta sp.]HQB54433.1 tRNA dihydrouridine synthase DusB [Sphaerochaeta sp.]
MISHHPIPITDALTLKGNLFLAPLAGYTDVPFRQLCIEGGADFTYTEMVSVEGLAREGEKTIALLPRAKDEKEYAIQLFLGEPASLRAALAIVKEYRPTMIDINAGCPVPKVTKTGAGSALMKNPPLIKEIIRIIKEETGIPTSAKFRIGWDQESRTYLEFADAAIDGGADLLTLHARTRAQGYAPRADWEYLTTLKTHLAQKGSSIPLIGSGDLFEAEDAIRMLRQTGVDGVMFARGAVGNPVIFNQTKALLEEKEKPLLTATDKVNLLLTHLHALAAHYNEPTACTLMRKFVGGYLKGMPHVAKVKQAAVQALTIRSYEDALRHLVSSEDRI